MTDSFKAAREAAAKHGYRLVRWVLCIPASMDGPTAQWWDGWRKRADRDHGVRTELWDETALRRELMKPGAVEVREHYYGVRVFLPPTPLDRDSSRLKQAWSRLKHLESGAVTAARNQIGRGGPDEILRLDRKCWII